VTYNSRFNTRHIASIFLFLLLFLLTAPGLNAEELTNYHLLTLTELEERVKQESDSVNLQFAIIRKLGQTDQSQAILVLAKLDPTQWNQSEALIAIAFKCELNIGQGLMAEAASFYEQLATENTEANKLTAVRPAIAFIAATELFYSTKGPAEGSGLGLAMVEGFMNQFGGQLAITSTLGVGTTVSLSFVAEVADAPKTATESLYCWEKTKNRFAPSVKQPWKVLVIEFILLMTVMMR
jgi:hypothetical protein